MRSFAHTEAELPGTGTTVLVGPNGSGKTTVLEAVAYLGTERSFRTSARDAMVRTGAERAIIRAALRREERALTIEAELSASGGARTLVNRQRVRGRASLAQAAPATVFSPEDLGVVQGPPARRRALLDDLLRLLDARLGARLDELDRVLRQRAALLRQAAGRLDDAARTTLDVWDDRLARTGEQVAAAREDLVLALSPHAEEAYGRLSHTNGALVCTYRRSWDADLAAALGAARADDVRRGVSTVGPHHDDLEVHLGGRSTRTRASQGEQRSVALALRLATHALATERTGSPPLLLLDDVFSELDPARRRALVAQLPAGQALLTTAADLPEGIEVAAVVDVRELGGGR